MPQPEDDQHFEIERQQESAPLSVRFGDCEFFIFKTDVGAGRTDMGMDISVERRGTIFATEEWRELETLGDIVWCWDDGSNDAFSS